MSAVNITNVAVLDNPTAFLNPFQFEISYECLLPLEDGQSKDAGFVCKKLAIDLLIHVELHYACSSLMKLRTSVSNNSLTAKVAFHFGRQLSKYDAEISQSIFNLEWKLIYVGSAEDENYDQLLESVLVGPVNVGTYRFVLQAEPPDPSKIREEDIIGVTVLLLTCSYTGQEFIRVGYYVNNDYDDEQLREEPPAKLLIDRVQRNILADKPRVTKFPINFHPETSAGAGQQQQQPQSASPENHASEGSKPNPDQ